MNRPEDFEFNGRIRVEDWINYWYKLHPSLAGKALALYLLQEYREYSKGTSAKPSCVAAGIIYTIHVSNYQYMTQEKIADTFRITTVGLRGQYCLVMKIPNLNERMLKFYKSIPAHLRDDSFREGWLERLAVES